MLLDILILFVGELTVFGNDSFRDTYLSDIVKKSRIVDIIALLIVLACKLGDLS